MGYRVEVHAEGAAWLAITATSGRNGARHYPAGATGQRLERHWVCARERRPLPSDLSEYDRSIGYNDQWLGKVHQHYKESQTLAMAKSKGYIFRGKEVIQTPNGPQIRLQFVAR